MKNLIEKLNSIKEAESLIIAIVGEKASKNISDVLDKEIDNFIDDDNKEYISQLYSVIISDDSTFALIREFNPDFTSEEVAFAMGMLLGECVKYVHNMLKRKYAIKYFDEMQSTLEHDCDVCLDYDECDLLTKKERTTTNEIPN